MTPLPKKRILFVVHGYPPLQAAGTENYTFSLAKELANNNFEIGVFYPIFTSSHNNSEVTQKNFHNHIVFTLKTNSNCELDHIFNKNIEDKFLTVVNKFKPHIIHFQHTHSILPTSLLHRATQLDSVTIATLHDFWYICPKTYLVNDHGEICKGPSEFKCAECLLYTQPNPTHGNSELFKKLVEYFNFRISFSKSIFDKIHLVSAPSQYVIDIYKKFLSFNNIVKVPLGLNFHPENINKKIIHDKIRFGFLGNISSIKNPHGLVEAFLNTTGPSELHFYGKFANKYLESELIKLSHIDDRIFFHGGYNPSNLKNILSNIDVGIIPSFFESYSLVLREFLAAKIPVLASRTGAIPEFIKHNVNGILFNPKDTNELKNIIQEITNNPNCLKKLNTDMYKIKSISQDALIWKNIYESFLQNTHI